MTADDVRALLKRQCDNAGSIRKWAGAQGVSAAYVSDVITGKRKPGEAICGPLGVRRLLPAPEEYVLVGKRA